MQSTKISDIFISTRTGLQDILLIQFSYISIYHEYTNRFMSHDVHPYTSWETHGAHVNKFSWTEQEMRVHRLERNMYMNMIEDDIVAALEAFDRKMCFDRGVTYDIELREEDGRRKGRRQIIPPDAPVIASTINPELFKERMNFLFDVSGYSLQTTFIQRVSAYLEAKIKEVEHAIQSNFRARYAKKYNPRSPTEYEYIHDTDAQHAFSIDSTLLEKIKFVYQEQFQKYNALHKTNIRHAYYKQLETQYNPAHVDGYGHGWAERFLTSRPSFLE